MSPAITPGEKVLAIGNFEVGKTTGLAYLLGGFDAAMVFDPEGELDPHDPVPTMRPENWTQITSLDQLDDVTTSHVSCFISYADVDRFAEEALANLGPNRAVGLMEMGSTISGTSPGSIPTHLGTLWRTAHKDNTSILAETHRLSEIPKLLRRANHLLAWRLPPGDVDALRREIGPKAETVTQLPEYEYLHATGAGVTQRDPFPLKPPPHPASTG